MNEPEPVDEGKPAPEIRGGDRPADYIPAKGSGGFGLVGWVATGDDDEDENEYEDGGDC